MYITFREDRVAFQESKELQLSKRTNKATGTVHGDSTLVGLMKIVLSIFITFQEYNEKFVATGIMNNVKDMMARDFLARMCAQFYYWYIWVDNMLLAQ